MSPTRLLTSFLILTLTSAYTSANTPGCPGGWDYFQSSADDEPEYCYQLFKYKMSRASAVALCAHVGGTLTTPKSSDQNDRITSFANTSAAWIGLNDIKSENTFIWADDRTLVYNDWSYWGSQQPNNRENSEHCVTVNFESKRWFDSDCNLRRYVVCQVDYDKAQNTCDVEKPPEYAHHDAENSTIPAGDVVVYRCDPGYDSVSGPTGRTCLINGKLSGVPFNPCLQVCPPGWSRSPRPDGTYCLKAYTESQPWEEANLECLVQGAYLAEPRTEDLNTFTASLVPTKEAWIGLTDLQKEGDFRWATNNDPLNFTSWSEYNPNNRGGVEHCVHTDINGEWNDKSCSSPLDYICQIEISLTRTECPVEKLENGKTLTNVSSVLLDESISYACNDDFTALSGTENRTCLIDGRLSGQLLVCSPSCPDGWTISSKGNYCYRYYPEANFDHDTAVEFCRNVSGTLPTPKNSEDNTKVSSLGEGSQDILLGLRDVSLTQTYVWDDGDLLSWTHWTYGHPLNGTNQDCVSVRPSNELWRSHSCKYTRRVVCQKTIHASREVCPVEGITNGTISTDAKLVKLGVKVNYTCDPGFLPARGDAVRTCTSFGVLSGQPLICVPECPPGQTLSPLGAFCYQVPGPKELSVLVRDIDQGEINHVIHGVYGLTELK